MQTVASHSKTRNYSLDLCKLIAACFVVLIHIPFPGRFGTFAACLARFAVPLFFAISGWYSYRIRPKTLYKRFTHLLLLEASAIFVNILCRIFWEVYYGGTVRSALFFPFSTLYITKWILFNANPFRDTLWYLSAAAMCNLILLIYTKLFGKKDVNYGFLYSISCILMAVFFFMDKRHYFLHLSDEYLIYYRNAVLFGLPCFSLGLFLRQYSQKIFSLLNTRKLLFLLFLGLLLACAEWYRFGYFEMYFGAILIVAALLLLTMLHPGLPKWLQKHADKFGTVSTIVYILHPEIIDFYARLIQQNLDARLLEWNAWLMPICIILISLAVSAITERFMFLMHKLCRQFLPVK